MPVGEDHSLSFLLLHPANTRKKYPTILVRNPYGRLTFFYFFFLFAEVRGPPHVHWCRPPRSHDDALTCCKSMRILTQGLCDVWWQRGFNVMVQDVRGRGESTGVFDCITDYEDGQATLNWIMSQVSPQISSMPPSVDR